MYKSFCARHERDRKETWCNNSWRCPSRTHWFLEISATGPRTECNCPLLRNTVPVICMYSVYSAFCAATANVPQEWQNLGNDRERIVQESCTSVANIARSKGRIASRTHDLQSKLRRKSFDSSHAITQTRVCKLDSQKYQSTSLRHNRKNTLRVLCND